jgi:hypothetical protein
MHHPVLPHIAGVIILTGALLACRQGEAPVTPPRADLVVSVRSGVIAAPDSIAAGWTRLRVEEDGEGHILVVFRLAGSPTDPELATFLTTLDTARATPAGALALGGPEVGDTGEVIIELTPGIYLLGCVRRGSEGHRHANTGEASILVVTEAPADAHRDTPPVATQEVGMVDFAYVGTEQWPVGSHLLRVENRGQQEHQLRFDRLADGTSLKDWMDAEEPGEIAMAVTGVARMGPGAVAYLPVDLSPGTYVAYCLIPDPFSGREHVEMGMLREIRVE